MPKKQVKKDESKLVQLFKYLSQSNGLRFIEFSNILFKNNLAIYRAQKLEKRIKNNIEKLNKQTNLLLKYLKETDPVLKQRLWKEYLKL